MLPATAYRNALALHQQAIKQAASPMAEANARNRYAICRANARAAHPHHNF